MTFLRFRFLIAAILAFTSSAWAADTASILPPKFAGWKVSKPAQASTDPAVADPVNAALLKEYGFTGFESATYVREDGRKLTIKAAQFTDASGAYGAFTYYRMPPMQDEKIGDKASSLNERVLFFRGNILVDAVFQEMTAMSAAELRELASDLPSPLGSAGKLPNLPAYLPKTFEKNTAKYVIGPVGLMKVSAPLPAQLVNFSTEPEIVLGTYRVAGGETTLMIIQYPTNQIAAERLRTIEAARQPDPAQKNGTTPIADLGPLVYKRTGPLLVIATADASASDAKSLLADVNYEANVTWNENTYFDKKHNIGTFVWGTFLLCGILMLFAVFAGLAFGGVRILLRRIFPNRMSQHPDELEFISLHLSGNDTQSADSEVSSTIKAG